MRFRRTAIPAAILIGTLALASVALAEPGSGTPAQGKESGQFVHEPGKPSVPKPEKGTPTTEKPAPKQPSAPPETVSRPPVPVTPPGEPTEPKPTVGKPTTPPPTDLKPSKPMPTEGQASTPPPAEGQPSTPAPTEGTPSAVKPPLGQNIPPKPTTGEPTKPKPTEGKPTTPPPAKGEPTKPKPESGQPTQPKPDKVVKVKLNLKTITQAEAEQLLAEGYSVQEVLQADQAAKLGAGTARECLQWYRNGQSWKEIIKKGKGTAPTASELRLLLADDKNTVIRDLVARVASDAGVSQEELLTLMGDKFTLSDISVATSLAAICDLSLEEVLNMKNGNQSWDDVAAKLKPAK